MPSDWFETTIGAQVTLQRGIDITKAEQRPGRVPVVSSGGVSSYHDTAAVSGPGVVLGRKGVVGSVYYIKEDFWPHDTSLWVKDFHGNTPRFVYYFFRSITSQLAALDVGSANPTLNRNHVHPIPVTWPDIELQRDIAAFLGALDDRIDLLSQTNATLEAIAQALFKSWFIDFDPVRAKAEGREPEGMDAVNAALFPAEFEESALGRMPKGWSTCRLGDLCTRMVNGGTPSRNKPEFWENGDIPWFKTGELSDAHLMHPSEYITERGVEGSSVKVLPRHSVLMAIYAAPTVGRLGVLTSPAAFNQACTGMVADESVGPWFLLQTLFHGRAWFNSRANGAAQQNISKQIVESYQCVRPSRSVLSVFNDVASHIYSAAERNSVQAQVLGELRDTLLPRLVSGKIRLPEAQELVAAV